MDTLANQSLPQVTPRKAFYTHLYFRVLLGFVLGIVIGVILPAAGDGMKVMADIFIRLIRMVLTPIIFGTVVLGIVQMGNLKEAGRVGVKALVYFEVVTTLALFIGLIVVNVFQPGAGMNVDPATLDAKPLAAYTTAAQEEMTGSGFFLGMIPTSFAEAFVSGKMLQVIFISVLFGVALGQTPNRGEPVVRVLESTLQAMFHIVRMIMELAPLAAMGAMAFAVGRYGLGSLISYVRLIACLYLTSSAFVFIVLGAICRYNGISLWKFLVYIKEEIFITFATASTESVFSRMLVKMERLGCRKNVVGLVLPAGYAFNADGGCIYLTMAAIFLAQATNTALTLQDQLLILAVCLFTSKGAAGVAGAGFIALAATLSSMKQVPVSSLVLLLGVDRFMNEARSVTNLIGNGIATVAVARWEKGFDVARARAVLSGEAIPEPETQAEAG